MQTRKYRPGEERELWRLAYGSIHATCTGEYTAEQLAAWAPSEEPPPGWGERIERNDPYVAEAEGRIVGFADLLPQGHIDLFYVAAGWQRQGVGRRLLAAIEGEAAERGGAWLSVEASLTARPFFAAHGFRVTALREVWVRGRALRNFRMIKRLVGV